MAKNKVVMLSFDVSTTDTGWALWYNGKLKAAGHVYLGDRGDINKTAEMSKRLIDIALKYNPSIIVCEEAVSVRNADVFRKLCEIIGSLRGASILLSDCWFDKLAPTEWRSLISNGVFPKNRSDCKPWDIVMAEKLHGYKTDNDNIADAILVGQAYVNLFGNNSIYAEEV